MTRHTFLVCDVRLLLDRSEVCAWPIVAVGTSNSIDNYGGLAVEKKNGDSNVSKLSLQELESGPQHILPIFKRYNL
jgi:hypothetical protein